MAYVKAAIKNAMREKLLGIDGIAVCWIERCTQSKDGTYDLDIGFSEDNLPLGVLEEISRVFQTSAVSVESQIRDYDEPHLEVGVSGATFSI